jgi:hypothetical protein
MREMWPCLVDSSRLTDRPTAVVALVARARPSHDTHLQPLDIHLMLGSPWQWRAARRGRRLALFGSTTVCPRGTVRTPTPTRAKQTAGASALQQRCNIGGHPWTRLDMTKLTRCVKRPIYKHLWRRSTRCTATTDETGNVVPQ